MKASKIIFIDSDLEKTFKSLSEKDSIKKALKRAIVDIKNNCYVGRNVKKKLIPRKLMDKYKINNLWIYNLPSAWRLLYSITSPEKVEIIAVILDWMDHKDYERLFKF